MDENGHDVTVVEAEHVGAGKSTSEVPHEWKFKLRFDPEHQNPPVEIG